MSESKHYKVTVLGGGSFGTALSNIVATNGHDTSLWVRDPERAAEVQRSRVNESYIPGYRLHERLLVTSDLASCVQAADVVVIAVPSDGYRGVAQAIKPYMDDSMVFVSATKGIESPNFTLMSQVLREELSAEHIGVLSGPNFAKEIVKGVHTGSVIASESERVLQVVPPVFSSKTFRVYTNPDPYGVELAGALKNIYAIISGMATAMGSGNNTHAMLITRSLAEMGRLAARLGADFMTFLGLAGVGDLVLTCGSNLSRNYRVGYLLGSGKTLEGALQEIGQVAEGVNTLRVVKQKADELGVYMPLVTGLNAIMFEGQDIGLVVQKLMGGEMTTDVEFQSKPLV